MVPRADCSYHKLCSFSNLFLAYRKARKGKTKKPYVLEFENELQKNIELLQVELQLHCYRPQPLKTFIIRDPKTRKISKSAFRDRIIHHALCNVIEPLFEKSFIFDSYANQKGKGTLKALQRFEQFRDKVTKNGKSNAYVFKADIRHYFDEVDHSILLKIINTKVKDSKIIWLIRCILNNYSTAPGKGMPLGNLTSQFFANVFLNELDQFAKHTLKAKYYIRYVDDFVIFHPSRLVLERYQQRIHRFLQQKLNLQLHPQKTRIIPIQQGTEFLGLKLFLHHIIIKKKNMRFFYRRYQETYKFYGQKKINYDSVYDFMEGWIAYAKNANTYNLRIKILRDFEQRYKEVSTKEINRAIKSNNVMLSNPS